MDLEVLGVLYMKSTAGSSEICESTLLEYVFDPLVTAQGGIDFVDFLFVLHHDGNRK